MAAWTDVDERIIDVEELGERGSRFWEPDFDPSEYVWLDDEYAPHLDDTIQDMWAGVH